MRLINTTTLKLEDFSLKPIPPYGILSHTWGQDEVTFQEMSSQKELSGGGYTKIIETCALSKIRGLGFAWVDTCCIDKTSSAELTEAINSMFRWYKNAVVCFVYLQDLEHDAELEVALPRCRWFTRGWTLQELIASKIVVFFDNKWHRRGEKMEMSSQLSTITKIPRQILHGIEEFNSYTIAARMTWAAHRKTTRVEDIAYCLLGIFDVNMPLIYGEGIKAFRRLQEEIIKRSNDRTIFFWEPDPFVFVGLFAPSPNSFTVDTGLSGRDKAPYPIEYTITNQGLRVSGKRSLILAYEEDQEQGQMKYVFPLVTWANGFIMGICLRKLGPDRFSRDGNSPLTKLVDPSKGNPVLLTASFNILTDIVDEGSLHIVSRNYRSLSLHMPHNKNFLITDAVPESLWDGRDRVFLNPEPHRERLFNMVLAVKIRWNFQGKWLDIIAICDMMTHNENPTCWLFELGDYSRLEKALFRSRNRNEYMDWADLKYEFPDVITTRRNYLRPRSGDKSCHIGVSFDRVGIKQSVEEEEWEIFGWSRQWYTMNLSMNFRHR